MLKELDLGYEIQIDNTVDYNKVKDNIENEKIESAIIIEPSKIF